MSKTQILLFLILILSSFLRLFRVGEVPLSPDWDEVALGYNAYSIMQTGRDEYGKFLPVVLRSFDDYKPALYTYLSIPSIAIFGLNVEAVRLPSIIFGIITVFATFFLMEQFFKRNDIALISSFLLAISPWHIQFSRIAFETNVAVAFNILGVLFFLYGLKKPWLIFLSSIIFALSIYIYQGEKVFIPLLILLLVFIYRKTFFSLPKKYIFISLILMFLISFPMINYLVINKDSLERAKGVSVFTEQIKHSQAQKFLDDKNNNDLLGILLDNRRVIYGKRVLEGYLSHFDLNWLFIRGDLGRHHAPFMGLLYFVELPFLLIGIYLLLFGQFDKKTKALIFGWLIITPVAASLTSGVPHAVRTLNFLPIFQIFTAIGLVWGISQISNLKFPILNLPIKYPIFVFIFSLSIFNFVYYLNQYFVQYNYFNAHDWQYGYAKIIPAFQKIEDKYKKVVISNQPPMDQSYMFFLFYLKYDPTIYQKYGRLASGGFRENHEFGKFEFRPIEWDSEKKDKETLYIGRASDFGPSAQELMTIYYPDRKPAIKIVQ